jgi:hypothetical protein
VFCFAVSKKKKQEGDLNTRPKQKGIANIADLVPAGLCSTTVPDTPNKLFCGAIPIHLTEEQVKELFCSFGALRGFNMVRDKAKGCYAFFEVAQLFFFCVLCLFLNCLVSIWIQV